LRRQIDRADVCAQSAGRDGYHTGSAADIEHPHALGDTSVSHQTGGCRRRERFERREMRSTFFLGLFELCYCIHALRV